jgi:hypothetical protein
MKKSAIYVATLTLREGHRKKNKELRLLTEDGIISMLLYSSEKIFKLVK